jgi:hypothetical protein
MCQDLRIVFGLRLAIAWLMPKHPALLLLVTAVVLTAPILLAVTWRRPDEQRPAPLDHRIDEILNEHGQGIEASVWIGDPIHGVWYERESNKVRPAASATKTAILVEFFARHHGKLDYPTGHPPALFTDPDHPALALFKPLKRQEITSALDGWITVRQLGQLMMGQRQAPNDVYNTAANIVIDDLGGPQAVTQEIHKRDPALNDMTVGWFLPTSPKQHENEASARSLARLMCGLAARSVPGVDAGTIDGVRETMAMAGDPVMDWYEKDGVWPSAPLTFVRTGWWTLERRTTVFVVISVQPEAGRYPPRLALNRQLIATDYIWSYLLDAERRTARNWEVEEHSDCEDASSNQ